MMKHTLMITAGLLTSGTAYAQPLFQPGPPAKILGCTVHVAKLPNTAKCLDRRNKRIAADAKRKLDRAVAAEKKKLASQVAVLATLPAAKQTARAMSGLKQCITKKRGRIERRLRKAAKNPIEFAGQNLQRMFRAAFQQSINHSTLVARAQGRKLRPREILDDVDRRMKRLAKTDPVTECLWSITEPFKKEMFRRILAQHGQFHKELRASVNKVVRPALDKALGELIRPLFKEVPRGAGAVATQLAKFGLSNADGLDALIDGLARKHLLKSGQINRLKTESAKLARLVREKKYSEIRAQQQRIKTLVAQLGRFDNKMAVEVGIEALRVKGHEVVEVLVNKLLDMALAGVDTGKDGAANGATAITGVAWEPTDAIGEAVATLVEGLYNFMIVGVKQLHLLAAHKAFDALMDQAKTSIMRGRTPSAAAKNGPLGPLLKHFPKERDLVRFSSERVRVMQADLLNYHTAIMDLTDAVVEGR